MTSTPQRTISRFSLFEVLQNVPESPPKNDVLLTAPQPRRRANQKLKPLAGMTAVRAAAALRKSRSAPALPTLLTSHTPARRHRGPIPLSPVDALSTRAPAVGRFTFESVAAQLLPASPKTADWPSSPHLVGSVKRTPTRAGGWNAVVPPSPLSLMDDDAYEWVKLDDYAAAIAGGDAAYGDAAAMVATPGGRSSPPSHSPGAMAPSPAPRGNAAWRRARNAYARRARTLVGMIGRPSNIWQHLVLSPGFQELLQRRMRILRKLLAVLATGHVDLQRKLALLSPLPLCAGLTYTDRVKLARLMKPKLFGRYTKVLRAGVPPPAFYVVVWGSLKPSSGGTIPVGGTVGRGALAALVEVEDDTAAAAAAGSSEEDHQAREVPVEAMDVQAAEPTLVLSLRLTDLPTDKEPGQQSTAEWFAALQRRYVDQQLKIAMLIGTRLLADAGRPFCAHLASLLHVREPKVGTRLYSAYDRPDCVYLLIKGAVGLTVETPPPSQGSLFVERARPPPVPIVVATRTDACECPWVGTGALFCAAQNNGDARRGHSATVTASGSQLLVLPHKNFGKFERLELAARVLVPSLRAEEQRLASRIADLLPEDENEDALAAQQARELAAAAQLRVQAQSEQRRRRVQAQQSADARAVFISSLVSAYTPQ